MPADKKKPDMARKKQEIQLQQEIETQEEWEEMMAKEGLWVVDIYQEWCGPCAAMVSNFRRLKNELGDDLLHFATAKVDTIDALDKYKGKCEPTFLYFACGVLVGVVHGSQSPLVMRTVTEQLAQEHKVVDGTSERKEVKDPLLSDIDDREKGELDEDETENNEESKGFTVAIIKPDAVRSGKVDEVLEQMKERGIEIIAEEERQLTEDEAREFYSHLKDEDYFEELVQFMSSGPSHMLVLTKGTSEGSVLTEWRDMIGPTSVEEAKEQAPDSLRAKYGSGKVMNALHGSSSPETAAREMAFFFPNHAALKQKSKSSPNVQRTLALIRPDAFKMNKDAIMEKIKQSGFKVALQKQMTLSKEQASEFYKEHKGQEYFDDLVTRMSSGPLMALGLAREDAIQNWREMLGPKEVDVAKEQAPDSLRAQFAVDDVQINQLHGSDSSEAAKKELEFFFPVEQTVACIKPDGIGTKDAIINRIHEAGFRIAAQKETVITRDIAEDFYAEHKDKEYFNDLVEHMTSGPTMFMVLSREDAVSSWRQAIGPTDPETAKLETPESIRAMFGKDVLQNAVHGSSDSQHAVKSIEQVFGHLEFNADGTVKDIKPVEQEEQQADRQSPVEQVGETAPEFKPDEEEQKPDENKDGETATQDTTEAKAEDTEMSQSETTQNQQEESKTETTTEEQSEKPVERESTPVNTSEESKTETTSEEQNEKPAERESTPVNTSEESKTETTAEEQSEKPDRESTPVNTSEESKTETTTEEQNEKPERESTPVNTSEESKTETTTEEQSEKPERESTPVNTSEVNQSQSQEENKTDQLADQKGEDSDQEKSSDQSKPTEEDSPANETDKKPDSDQANTEAKTDQTQTKDDDSSSKKDENATDNTEKPEEIKTDSAEGATTVESKTDDDAKPKTPET